MAVDYECREVINKLFTIGNLQKTIRKQLKAKKDFQNDRLLAISAAGKKPKQSEAKTRYQKF